MALPSSGQLSFSQIQAELGNSNSNSSLRAMSGEAGFGTPDAVSEFYGFSSGSPYNFGIAAKMNGYGTVSTDGFQDGQAKWNLLAQHYSYGNITQKANNVTLNTNSQVTINATAMHYWNYIGLDIYTTGTLLYSSSSNNYNDISTTQYKTFTSSDVSTDPFTPNTISVVATGYYQY